MQLRKTLRRLCPGKEIRFEIAKHNPFDWIRTNDSVYVSNVVDGFIVGVDRINGVFVYYEYIEEQDDDINKLISALLNENESALKLAKILGCPFRIFIWPLNYPQGFDTSLKKIFSITDKSTVKSVSLKDLEEGIKKLRGFSFDSPKSLLTANSYLECYLANKTNNPWPGDLDGIIYNKEKDLIEVLIEFKTHNIDSATHEEYIGKYNMEDWRRFEVLFKLQKNIENKQSYKPKLYYIVWGTQDFENHSKIKIDLIEDNQLAKTFLMDRPVFGHFSRELFSQLIIG